MLFLCLQALIKPSKNKRLRNVIALCVLLTPIYALADNHFSSWSDKTICRLAKATPDKIEYQAESTKRGLSCGGSHTANSSASSQKVAKALAGIDIENDPTADFFKPPQKPYPTGKLYWFGRMWRVADYNNDGISDVLYIGTMNADNAVAGSEDTGDICGTKACSGSKPLPSLYLGDKKGQLTYSPQLLIDDRKESGMSLGSQLLVADFNNDNVLDFYVSDNGVGTHNGYRDSYFLSQPNGIWAESSETHLSHSNFVVFDHGGATGDIDNDGDMDVVITELYHQKNGTSFWCLMNDGSGFLKKRKCGGAFAFGLELADMDGDGDLDALVGAHEYGGNQAFTGIVWNNGKGYFSQKTALPQHKKKWGTIPEVSASDLDDDGDLDIVYSRAGVLYVGTALQIIENLGNKKFKDRGIFPLIEAPDDFKPVGEGNEWNDFIENISFRDFDKDGDNDIYLSSSMSQKTDGMVLINDGDFKFSLLKPSEKFELYEQLDNSNVIISKQFLTSEAKIKETENSIKFDTTIKKNGDVVFEGVDKFTKFDIGIPLNNSGALLVGFKDLKVVNDYSLNVRTHIKYGNIDFSVNVCFEYYLQHQFMAARTSFNRNDWGGLNNIMPSSGCIGEWELESDKPKLQEIGVYTVLNDIQKNTLPFLEALDEQTDGSVCFLLKRLVTDKKCTYPSL